MEFLLDYIINSTPDPETTPIHDPHLACAELASLLYSKVDMEQKDLVKLLKLCNWNADIA
jgi:hypothetical protein